MDKDVVKNAIGGINAILGKARGSTISQRTFR